MLFTWNDLSLPTTKTPCPLAWQRRRHVRELLLIRRGNLKLVLLMAGARAPLHQVSNDKVSIPSWSRPLTKAQSTKSKDRCRLLAVINNPRDSPHRPTKAKSKISPRKPKKTWSTCSKAAKLSMKFSKSDKKWSKLNKERRMRRRGRRMSSITSLSKLTRASRSP